MTQTVRSRVREIVTLPAAAVQIMGDSVSAGINAATVAKAAGLPENSVANYSLPGTSPLFAWFTLRRQLAAGRAPKLIVYAPHPANLNSPMVDRFIGRFATGGEALDLLRNRVPPAEWLFGAACRFSYTLRYREELQSVVTQGNLEFFRTLHNPIASVVLSQKPGIEPAPPAAREVAFSEATLAPQLTKPFFVAPENATYIEKFCDLAAANNIRIAWISMPTIAVLTKKGSGNTTDGRYFAFLESVARRHSNVTILHREIDVMEDRYFSDPRHLNPYGAFLFSERVGQWLLPWLAGMPETRNGG